MVVADTPADVAQRLGVVRHQGMVGVLAEHGGDRTRIQSSQFSGRPWTDVAKTLGQPSGDREVTAASIRTEHARPATHSQAERTRSGMEAAAPGTR